MFIIMKLVVVLLSICYITNGNSVENDLLKPTEILTSRKVRNKRELDEEDVINRFEMERVSPIYDILRYLPPFEDGWIPPPLTEPTPLLSPTLDPQRDHSTYSEFKFEISKDKEHVVSESGRQFRENSALNWFYSGNSYSSLLHFTIPSFEQRQHSVPTTETSILSTISLTRTTAAAPPDVKLTTVVAKNTLPVTEKTYTSLPTTEKTMSSQVFSEDLFRKDSREAVVTKQPLVTVSPNSQPSDSNQISPMRRRQDHEHVVSQVPGLRSNQGIFVNADFVVPSTTPKLNLTVPKTEAETKPNVTTRYILLQSGRIVAINVTSPPKVLKSPSDASYFGSRIRNKKLSVTDNTTRNEKSILQNKVIQPIILTSPDIKLNSEKNKSLTSTNKQNPLLRPIISFREVRLLFSNGNMKNNPKSSSQNASNNRLFETLIDVFHPGTTESQYFVITFDSVKKKSKNPPLRREFSLHSNEKQKNNRSDESSTISFQEEKRIKPQMSNPLKGPVFKNKNKPNIATTVVIATISNRAPKRFVETKPLTTESLEKRIASTSDTLQTPPPNPVDIVRHDFVRIVTLQPPTTKPTTQKISLTSATTTKAHNKVSRRPRYRGLSHINLQSPKREKAEKQISPMTTQKTSTSSSTTQASPIRSRQNEFHFRNSVSFQTIPMSSFSDRRSLSSSTIAPQPAAEESPTKRSKVLKNNALIFSFEPTRRSARTNLLRNTTVTPQSERNATLRNRQSAERFVQTPWWTQVTAPTSSSIPNSKPVTKLIERSTRASSTTTKTIPDRIPAPQNSAQREGRNFRASDFKTEVSSTVPNSSSTTVTGKPYRVYFFEPKRKKNKRVDESVEDTDKETKIFVNTNNYESSSRRSRHRQLNNSFNTTLAVSRSPKRIPSTQAVSETTSTTTILLPKSTSRKPRYIPFIRHQPNVGTKSPKSEQRTTKSTTKRPATVIESTLESESFLDYVHRPFDIRRTG